MTGQMPENDAVHDTEGAATAPSKKKVVLFSVLGAVIVIALLVWVLVTQVFAGDTNEVTPPKPVTTTKPTKPTTEPEKPAAPIVLPSCEALNPQEAAIDAEARARYAAMEHDPLSEVTPFQKFPDRFGPAAVDALSGAVQSRECVYVRNLETFLATALMEIREADKDAFLEKLRADSDFVESTVDGATVFTWKQVSDEGHWGESNTVHAFIGNVWYASFGPWPVEDSLPTSIASIRAANPTLP